MFGQRVELARHVGGLGNQVRFVGILRDHPQRLALTATTDHHGDPAHRSGRVERVVDLVVPAREAGLLAAQHRQDDLQGLLQLLEAIGERSELDAKGVMLQLEPTGTNAQLGAAARHDVESRHRLRQDCWVPVCVARDKRAQPHTRCLPRQR